MSFERLERQKIRSLWYEELDPPSRMGLASSIDEEEQLGPV